MPRVKCLVGAAIGAGAVLFAHAHDNRLMTNNPEKVAALRGLGVTIEGRHSAIAPHNPFSAPYLEAKRLRMGHVLPSITAGAALEPQAKASPDQ